MTPGSNTPRLLRSVAVPTLAVVVFFALVEGALRLLGIAAPGPESDPARGFLPFESLFREAPDSSGEPQLVVRTPPHALGFMKLPQFNPQSHPARKSPGEFRILVMGGSLAYGWPHDDRLSFPRLLEVGLRRVAPEIRWRVINMGAPGWGTTRLRALSRDLLRLDPAVPAISKRIPELRIDLSAVAKGYAVDRVAEALFKAGHADYLVEIGGEVRVHGHNIAEVPWRLGIERPQIDGRAIHTVVLLTDGSLATSGDYRLYRNLGNHRISHIIDPRNGKPIEHRPASVSVIDELCVRADAYATALLVLGPDEGMRLAEEEGLAVLFLTQGDGGQIVESSSPQFDQLVARTVISDNTEETS